MAMKKKMNADLALRILKKFVLDECVGADFDMLSPDQTMKVMKNWWSKNRERFAVTSPGSKLNLLLSEITLREKYLKSQPDTLENKARLLEIELCIVRVQQMLLENLKP